MPNILPLPPELDAPEDAPALADIYRDDLVEAGTELPSRWHIGDDRAAEWAMRQLVRHMAVRDEVVIQANAWMQQINEWLNREQARLLRAIGYFDGQLRTYALARRVLDEDAKTLRLPSGVVNTTARQPSVTITDEPALIKWLKDKGYKHLITVTESVKVSDLKPVVSAHHDRAVWHVKMDCGDEYDTHEPDSLFCRVCGVQAIVLDNEIVVHETWAAQSVDFNEPVPGVTVRPGRVDATVVPNA